LSVKRISYTDYRSQPDRRKEKKRKNSKGNDTKAKNKSKAELTYHGGGRSTSLRISEGERAGKSKRSWTEGRQAGPHDGGGGQTSIEKESRASIKKNIPRKKKGTANEVFRKSRRKRTNKGKGKTSSWTEFGRKNVFVVCDDAESGDSAKKKR